MKKNKWTKLVKRIKFLNNPKYYKNNVWSLAAYDSWAAQGKTPHGCSCCFVSHYNKSLENKRRPNVNSHFRKKWQCNPIVRLCSDCANRIEEIIDYKFKCR